MMLAINQFSSVQFSYVLSPVRGVIGGKCSVLCRRCQSGEPAKGSAARTAVAAAAPAADTTQRGMDSNGVV
jgi:hypothetical protein